MFVEGVITTIGWFFLTMSWVVPYIMRRYATTFEDRQKSYAVGMFFSAVALVIFVISGVVYYIK